MKLKLIGVLLVGMAFVAGQSTLAADLASTSEETLLSRVKVLTSAQYAGRGSGTVEGEAVADLLAQWFKNAGLQPGFGDDYFQKFPLSGNGWTGDWLPFYPDQEIWPIVSWSSVPIMIIWDVLIRTLPARDPPPNCHIMRGPTTTPQD